MNEHKKIAIDIYNQVSRLENVLNEFADECIKAEEAKLKDAGFLKKWILKRRIAKMKKEEEEAALESKKIDEQTKKMREEMGEWKKRHMGE